MWPRSRIEPAVEPRAAHLERGGGCGAAALDGHGRPSNREQISTTDAALAAISKPGLTDCARLTKRRTASARRTSSIAADASSALASSVCAISAEPSAAPAAAAAPARPAGSTAPGWSPPPVGGQPGQEVGDQRRRARHLLEVIENQQQMAVPQVREDEIPRRFPARITESSAEAMATGTRTGLVTSASETNAAPSVNSAPNSAAR